MRMSTARDFYALPYEGEWKGRTLRVTGEKGRSAFDILSLRRFRELTRDDSCEPCIRGYVKEKNEKYTNREYGTLHLRKDAEEFCADVYSKKPRFSRTYGYIQVPGGYLMVVRDRRLLYLLALLLLVLLLALLGFRLANKPLDPTGPTPHYEVVEDIEDDEMVVSVILPDGTTTIKATVFQPGTEGEDRPVYTGEAALRVMQNVDGEPHTLLDMEAQVTAGKFPELCVDFPQLDHELIPGVYRGTGYVTFPDGTVEEYEAGIVIREKTGGTVEVMYSNEIHVNTAAKTLSLEYTQGPSSHNTKIRVVLVDGSGEYILAESDVLNPGDSVQTLSLDKKMAAKLQSGTYQGIIRVFLLSSDSPVADINSDIEAEIIVD